MKAMILAAGLGQRMRPLTDSLPKPLLCAGDKPLLHYHLENLRGAGVNDVIINLAYLGEKIEALIGDGSGYGLCVNYSRESEPLETGGGVSRALHLLGDEPFLLINGDVWSEFPFRTLVERGLVRGEEGHLVVVPNPGFHPQGDFSLAANGYFAPENSGFPRYTFAGISLLRPSLIAQYPKRRNKFPLNEVFRYAIANQQLTGEIFQGLWSDVGTPERLAELDALLRSNQVSILKS